MGIHCLFTQSEGQQKHQQILYTFVSQLLLETSASGAAEFAVDERTVYSQRGGAEICIERMVFANG